VSLGTVYDVNEKAITTAYEKQVKDDPGNIIFYLECLQDISNSMQSRKINQFADSEVLKGTFTRFDLRRAFRTLEIDDPNTITDEGLIVVFQSRRVEAPQRAQEFQFALKIIQHFRGSDSGLTTSRGSTGKRRKINWKSN
jgi:hypothetical protein